jgi:hypothetical protein
MNQHLTIAYCSSRKEPKFQWFLDSLRRECKNSWDGIKVVVVSLHELPIHLILNVPLSLIVVPPKPNVWQGKFALTKEPWFAAANSRNTALCLAPDGYIAYADDLSVLLPGWLDRVKAAIDGQYIVCGSYQKVKDLVVENGEVKSFTEFEAGKDTRQKFTLSPLHPCVGGWLYGCSCAMPVEALLKIGGWPEFCDGLGFEDCVCGVALKNANDYPMFYDSKMMTYESEELHHVEPALKKTDKGISPDDKSHRAINIVQNGQKFFDNYYKGGIRTERERVLRGEPFEIRNNPQHCWYDGQLVSEMKAP